MANLFDSAMTFTAAALKGNCGDTVTYQRGADSVSIVAVSGTTEFDRDDGDGAQVHFRSADWLITAADLILLGSVTVPRRGDKIVKTSGSKVRTYEILVVDGSAQYAYMDDDGGQMIRIHTKLIREEPA
jgi:hypothetical protein